MGAYNNHSVNSLLDLLFDNRIPLSAAQNRQELGMLIDFLAERELKNFLEIGTCGGGTFLLLSSIIGGKQISVDLPYGEFGGGYRFWKIPLYKSFANDRKSKVYLIRGSSQSIKTFEKVDQILNGEKLDVLFIDGDHTYDGVKSDFVNFSKYVKDKGFIIFHDILVKKRFNNDLTKEENIEYGVYRLWNEIKSEFDSKEIVAKNSLIGIGVLEFCR